jgi:hypothetical protein
MQPDLFAPNAHFRAFGYVVLRRALTSQEIARLRHECQTAVRDATGPWFGRQQPGGGIEGHYIPASGAHTPVSLELCQRFAGTAEQLLGRPALLAFAHHTLFFDAAGWHTDTGHDVPSLKVAAYLEPLDATSGALRLLSCSHRMPWRDLHDILQDATVTGATKFLQIMSLCALDVTVTRG